MNQANKVHPDVTVNVTAHREGYLLYRTIKGALACCKHAQQNGISTAININLDNADTLTTDIAMRFKKSGDANVYINSFGEPSSSRNFLVSKTTGDYILMLDGDDLFSEDFISKSVAIAEKFGRPCVVSAEKIFKFNHSVNPLVHIAESTVDKPEIKSALFETNLYVSQNLVSTKILREHKYSKNTGNYAFEDWHWNTKVIAAGYEFLVAVETAFFYRQKPDEKSLLRFHTNSNMVIRDTPLFAPNTFKNLPFRKYVPPVVPDNEPINHIRHHRVILRHILGTDSISYRGVRKLYRIARAGVVNFRSRYLTIEDNIQAEMDIETTSLQISPNEKATWNKLNSIEPIIRFDSTNETSFTEYRYTFEHSLVTAYYEFSLKYGNVGFTDIIFVPWINAGGADMVMLRLCRVLVGTSRKVLLITTSGEDSQWADKAREIDGVTFIQSHDDIFRHLDHKNIKLMFLRIVQNWNISTMSVMNSAIGFELVDRFGDAIKDTGCKVIIHSYAMPTHDGLIVDAFPTYSQSLDKIDVTITDSDTYKQELMKRYGIPDKYIKPLFIPIDEKVRMRGMHNPTRRILYANRIAREKQPEVAIESLKLIKSADVQLDMYGVPDEEFIKRINFSELVDSTSNVRYKGTYNGAKDLDFSMYDICLIPSLYEGTPNIVLESIKAGLYVIGTRTGGMPEIIRSAKSGKLLRTDAQPEDFAQEIDAFYDNSKLHSVSERLEANRAVLTDHSEEQYEGDVKMIYGVINHGTVVDAD